MERVYSLQLLAFHRRLQRDVSVHVAHVLHGRSQVVAAQLGLKRIVGHGLFAHLSQRAVDPFRGIAPGQGVSAQRNLEEVEPFGICLLADIWGQEGRIKSFRVGFDFHSVEQIFVFGYKFRTGASGQQGSTQQQYDIRMSQHL